MATKNDITGDVIRSKPSRAYSDNWEKIFGKDNQRASSEATKDMAEATESRSKKK